MKIAFHSNQLGLRGTEVSLYNYAKYNEEILGNQSIIVSFEGGNFQALDKFKSRFETVIMPWSQYEQTLRKEKVDCLYMQKAGWNDGYYLNSIPTLVHSVFKNSQFHGHKFGFISDYLAKIQGYSPEEYSVPYLVDILNDSQYSLREKLHIDPKHLVFGYHGGCDQFSIKYVQKVIEVVLIMRSDIHFIFMNVNPWINHTRVHFLKGTYNLKEKASFIDACDAMIHARADGETFGMSIAEFAVKNKPVITQKYLLDPSYDYAHLDMLQETAITYYNNETLYNILTKWEEVYKNKCIEIQNRFDKNYIKYSTPMYIMERFRKVFLS